MSHSERSQPPPLPHPPPVIDYRAPDDIALLQSDPTAQARRARRLIGSGACLGAAALCAGIAIVLLRAIDRNSQSLCSFAWPVLVLVALAAFLVQRGVRLFNSRNL